MWVIIVVCCKQDVLADDLRQHGFLVNNGNAVPLRSGTPFPCVPADFYPRDAMLARVFATATCPAVSLSVRLSHAGIVPSRAKAGS